jgi:hypothetical protein
VELTDDSGDWPCDLVAAKSVRLKVAAAQVPSGGGGSGGAGRRPPPPNVCVAEADFEPSQIQDLGDAVPRLLDIKARTNLSLRFHVRLEIGDGVTAPDPKVVEDVNRALEGLGGSFKVN